MRLSSCGPTIVVLQTAPGIFTLIFCALSSVITNSPLYIQYHQHHLTDQYNIIQFSSVQTICFSFYDTNLETDSDLRHIGLTKISLVLFDFVLVLFGIGLGFNGILVLVLFLVLVGSWTLIFYIRLNVVLFLVLVGSQTLIYYIRLNVVLFLVLVLVQSRFNLILGHIWSGSCHGISFHLVLVLVLVLILVMVIVWSYSLSLSRSRIGLNLSLYVEGSKISLCIGPSHVLSWSWYWTGSQSGPHLYLGHGFGLFIVLTFFCLVCVIYLVLLSIRI